MLAMTFRNQVSVRESVEHKPWTAQDWREISVFFAQSVGLVGAAILLYTLGPALGVTLIAISLAGWSLLRRQTAAGKEEDDSSGEEGGPASTTGSPSHCADPSWLRNTGMPSAPSARPVIRQGA